MWRRLLALCLVALVVMSCSTAVDDPPAPVISSRAPVDYEARDFVLHLYAQVCQALTGPVAYSSSDEGPYESEPDDGLASGIERRSTYFTTRTFTFVFSRGRGSDLVL